MNKPYSTMKTNVGYLIQDTSSAMGTRIGVWINNKYRDAINRYDWEELYLTQSLTASANVSACALNDDVDRLIFVLDATNGIYLTETSNQEFLQEHYDDFDITGTPERCFISRDCVRSQPASATVITAKSSSTSDTTQSLLIRSIVSGVEIYESLTLNGTSVITASAANSSSRIISISKSASTVGYVTVMENDGTVLSIIPGEKLESRYNILNLHPIPTGEVIYHIRAKRRMLPLSQDYDYPLVEGLADAIEYGAAGDALRSKRQFSKAREMDFHYEKLLAEAIFKRTSQPNQVILTNPSSLNRDDGIL